MNVVCHLYPGCIFHSQCHLNFHFAYGYALILYKYNLIMTSIPEPPVELRKLNRQTILKTQTPGHIFTRTCIRTCILSVSTLVYIPITWIHMAIGSTRCHVVCQLHKIQIQWCCLFHTRHRVSTGVPSREVWKTSRRNKWVLKTEVDCLRFFCGSARLACKSGGLVYIGAHMHTSKHAHISPSGYFPNWFAVQGPCWGGGD